MRSKAHPLDDQLVEQPQIKLNFTQAPETTHPVYLHNRCSLLKIQFNGPFARNQQGQLVCVHDKTAYLSNDEGQSWIGFKIFKNNSHLSITDSHSILCTQGGAIIVSFVNVADMYFNWHRKANKPTQNTRLFHYVVKSEDGGKSWSEAIKIQSGYAATATTLIELKSGALLLSAQNLDYEQARHYSLSFRSNDNGKTWQASNKLDIGGRGHHDGCYEGTLVELEDKIWFCIRTNLDYFWNAYSYDDGKSWTQLQLGLPASSSPAMLKRLMNGHIIMLYNPLYPTLNEDYKSTPYKYPRRGGLFSEKPASWQREELAAIISSDEGKSWSQPVIVAQCQGAWLAYPYLFEAQPGEIWVTTMQSQLGFKLPQEILLSNFSF